MLDLGCGNGALTHILIEAGYDAMGCDADKEGIEIAKKGGGVFKAVGVYDDPLTLEENAFDTVVSVEVVEHLFQPRFLPKFAKAVLKKGGYLVISAPYHGYLKNLMLTLSNKWDKHLDPFWDGGHIKFWSQATLQRLLTEEGFTVKNFYGAGRFPYLWKSMIMVAKSE